MRASAGECGLATASDLMAAIGFGKYSCAPGAEQAFAGSDSRRPACETEPGRGRKPAADVGRGKARPHACASDSLQVEGQDDLLVYRARCCNPIRGEEIVGYVTRGKGVAVHARSCPNVQNLLYESDRRISVEWARMAEEECAAAR